MECTRCELCAAAAEVFLPSSFSYFALLFQIVSGPLLIVLNSLLAAAVFRSKNLPYNARILLFLFCISMAISNIGIFTGALINLIVSFVLPEDRRCEYQVFSPHLHQAYQILTEIGFYWMIFSLLALCIERVASCFYRYPTKPFLLVLCSVQVFSVLILLFFTNIDTIQILPYHAAELRNTDKYQGLLDISSALSALDIVIFSIILKLNLRRKISTQNSTINQVHNSIFSIDRILLHISLFSACSFLATQLISRFSMPNIGPEAAITSQLLAEVTSYSPYGELKKCIVPTLTILISITILTESRNTRRFFIDQLHVKTDKCRQHSSQWQQKETNDELPEP